MKPYFNSAITGNGRMLACFSENGELCRLFWPDIGYIQLISRFMTGLRLNCSHDARNLTWLHETPSHSHYEDRYGNVLITEFTLDRLGLKIVRKDFVPPAEGHADILVSHYTLTNSGVSDVTPELLVYSSSMSSAEDPVFTTFDQATDSIVHSRHNVSFAVFSNLRCSQFKIGTDPQHVFSTTEFEGIDHVGLSPDAAAAYRTGVVRSGESAEFALYLCAAANIRSAVDMAAYISKQRSPDAGASASASAGADTKADNVYSSFYAKNAEYWRSFSSIPPIPIISRVLEKHSPNDTGSMRATSATSTTSGTSSTSTTSSTSIIGGTDCLDGLFHRSRMVFRLLSDLNGGGILAAPELDEGRTRSGGYGYCWPRDAGFITAAFDLCGLCELSDKFFDWAARSQSRDGSWHQRYHINGNQAPSWGEQYDETGTVVWGILRHYESNGDIDFLRKMWDCVRMACEFLVSSIDPETGIPGPCYDIWEERFGEHAYTAAAVFGGLEAGTGIARILGKKDGSISGGAECDAAGGAPHGTLHEAPHEAPHGDAPHEADCEKYAARWEKAAADIRDSILRNFWDEERGLFTRSIRVKLNPWGDEHSAEKITVRTGRKRRLREVTLADATADISLLGLSIPFGVFSPQDTVMRRTAERLEKELAYGDKGFGRYADDTYIGGNPWVIAALWLALYYSETGEISRAEACFKRAVMSRTRLDFLPEQADAQSLDPAWVIPLTWSHAMFILALAKITGDNLHDSKCN